MKNAIREYKQIILEEQGVELSLEEATEQATDLLNLFSVFDNSGGNLEQ